MNRNEFYDWCRQKKQKMLAFLLSCIVVVETCVEKAVSFAEDLMTDVNKKADVRSCLGIADSVVIFELALKVPNLIGSGKTFDIVAYSAVISLLIGFALALFGISKSSLDAGNDKSPPGEGLMKTIHTAVSQVTSRFTGQ